MTRLTRRVFSLPLRLARLLFALVFPAPEVVVLRVPTREALVGGRYALESQVGEGGMGAIWQARHQTLGSRVAIKFLHPSAVARPGARDRFLREAQLMAQLSTRRVVKVFDFGITEDRVPYLVMELVDGETLADKIAREQKLSARTTARILGEVAKGLEKAHAAGIVHRDLKPENILLTLDEDGEVAVKVADFGVAKLCAREAEPKDTPAQPAKSGAAGTPLYMAPEQLRGDQAVDASADIWAFGVCAYECLTGELPFKARDLPSLLSRMELRSYEPASLLTASLPYAFDAWFERACARTPARRFPSVRIAADELSIALGSDPLARTSGQIFLAEPRASSRIDSRDRHQRTPLVSRPSRRPSSSIAAHVPLVATSILLLGGAVIGAAFLHHAHRDGAADSRATPVVIQVEASAVTPAVLPAVDLAPAPATPPRRATIASPAQVSLPPSYRALPEDLPAARRVSASFKSDPY